MRCRLSIQNKITMKRSVFIVSLLMMMQMLCMPCQAQRRIPSLGLALCGGGAKAAAEVGVLKSLDNLGVKPSYIAGSSMGAFVGGLYAAGYTGEEIEAMWLDESWIKLFCENAVGSGKPIDNSDVERTIFGLVDGDAFEARLREKLRAKHCERFEDLRGVKFCCTATEVVDNLTLREEDISTGDMAKAIRASLSYPVPLIGFSPVYINGKQLVDGGMLNNLPVDVVKGMGASHVITVDLEMKQKTVASILQIGLLFLYDTNSKFKLLAKDTRTEWLLRWVRNGKAIQQRHDDNWNMSYVKIKPMQLVDFNILSFNRDAIRRMVREGRRAMDDMHYKVEDLIGL